MMTKKEQVLKLMAVLGEDFYELFEFFPEGAVVRGYEHCPTDDGVSRWVRHIVLTPLQVKIAHDNGLDPEDYRKFLMWHDNAL